MLGFAVENVDPGVEGLESHGIALERFANFSHDRRGIWTAPDGTRLLWFRDPDGNLLSAVQYGRT